MRATRCDAPAGDRRPGRERQVDARGGAGAGPRGAGLSDAGRVLQPAAGGIADGGPGRCAGARRAGGPDLPPTVRGAGREGRDAAPPARPRSRRRGGTRRCPGALAAAIERLPDERYHAILVDEGQDFARPGSRSCAGCSRTPTTSSGWSTTRARRCARTTWWASSACERYELFENLRNPGSVAKLASRFYRGASEVSRRARRPGGIGSRSRSPGAPTLERLRTGAPPAACTTRASRRGGSPC